MKSTDYAPRAAAMDVYLMGKTNLIGAEIGVDAGAHAEALLTYINIKKITLIDIWENKLMRGMCEGRLFKWIRKTDFMQTTSASAAKAFKVNTLDFIYVDIAHDYNTVKESLIDWWANLKSDGIMGYRNYSTCQKAIDEFVKENNVRTEVDKYHNEIILFK